MRNKKGNIFLGASVAIVIWVFGILFLPFIMDDVVSVRAALECSTTTISGGTMLSCLAVSGIIPYLILTFAALAFGFIAGSKR